MFGKVLPAACLAALVTATPARADLKDPAELPPAAFQGQQYVDSTGCVFLRAVYGDTVSWVPRVTKDRKQLCGYPPTDLSSVATPTPKPVVPAEPAPAEPAPGEATASEPAAPEPAPAPVAVAEEAPVAVVEAAVAPVPKPEPKPAAKPKVRSKAVAAAPQPTGHTAFATESAAVPGTPAQTSPLKVILRQGNGGTTELEGVVVGKQPDGRRVVQIVGPAPGPLFVQIGTFAVPSNAEGAAGRLRGLGLPVSRGALKGGALQVVYAGPFATAAAAEAALAAVRQAGFSDALIVK